MVEFLVFGVVLIVGALIKNASNRKQERTTPSPRMQRLIERVQTQQPGSQPTQFQGQYTNPTSGQGSPNQSGRAQSSAQVAGVLQQLLQAGKQPTAPGQYPSPGQYAPPGQFQPATWVPQSQAASQAGRGIPGHRPPQNNLPSPKDDIDKRVRELMASGHEVGAVRLLCDERDMGIIDAQKYARRLVAPQGQPAQSTYGSSTPETPQSASRPAPAEEETRYVGSAAFAESVFTTDADENVWASGWVDKPEPEDRSDMDELWQTVRNSGRPNPTTGESGA